MKLEHNVYNGAHEYSVSTHKGTDLDRVIKGPGGNTTQSSQVLNTTFENKDEVKKHLRLLKHIDRLDETLSGATNLPDILLDCSGDLNTADTTYCIEDLAINLNPDRAHRLFLSNIPHVIPRRLYSGSGCGAGDSDDSKVRDIVNALELKCCNGENCTYKTHYLPQVICPGPVILPNSAVASLKYMLHTVTNVEEWNAFLESMIAGLHRYIAKFKKINEPSGLGYHPSAANNLAKDDNPSRDHEGLFVCACCLFTRVAQFAMERDNRLLPHNLRRSNMDKGIAVRCQVPNGGKRYILFSTLAPTRYGVSFGSSSRHEENYAHDHLGINNREVVYMNVNFAVYRIERNPGDNKYVVRIVDD